MDNSESLLTCAIHLRNCLPPPCSPPPLPTHKLPALPTPPHIYTHPGILRGANTGKRACAGGATLQNTKTRRTRFGAGKFTILSHKVPASGCLLCCNGAKVHPTVVVRSS